MNISRRLWTLLGLLLVPLVVAGGFLWATWDFDSRLERVEAAVVNNDEPVRLDGQLVPLGRQLAGGLVEGPEEENFRWTLTDNEDAADGLAAGRYAAVVTIPADFSARATSFSENDADQAERATIQVQTSEVSGIADPVVGRAVTAAATRVLNTELTEQYLNGIYLGFNQLNKQFGTLADGAEKLADGAGDLSDGLGQTATGGRELATGLDQLDTGADQLATGVSQLSTGVGQFSTGIGQLSTGVTQTANGADDLADGTAELATGADELADGAGDLSSGIRRLDRGAGPAGRRRRRARRRRGRPAQRHSRSSRAGPRRTRPGCGSSRTGWSSTPRDSRRIRPRRRSSSCAAVRSCSPSAPTRPPARSWSPASRPGCRAPRRVSRTAAVSRAC